MAIETMASADGARPRHWRSWPRSTSERLAELMKACREIEVNVLAVEASSLATWRAWAGPGVQARLVCAGIQAALLAGRDDKLLFCRTIEVPIQVPELQDTIARAASVLACEAFPSITVRGSTRRPPASSRKTWASSSPLRRSRCRMRPQSDWPRRARSWPISPRPKSACCARSATSARWASRWPRLRGAGAGRRRPGEPEDRHLETQKKGLKARREIVRPTRQPSTRSAPARPRPGERVRSSCRRDPATACPRCSALIAASAGDGDLARDGQGARPGVDAPKTDDAQGARSGAGQLESASAAWPAAASGAPFAEKLLAPGPSRTSASRPASACCSATASKANASASTHRRRPLMKPPARIAIMAVALVIASAGTLYPIRARCARRRPRSGCSRPTWAATRVSTKSS